MSNAVAAAIAVTRFGLGGRPGEIEAAAADPAGHLLAQITWAGAEIPDPPAPPVSLRLARFRSLQQLRRLRRQAGVAGVGSEGGTPTDPVAMAARALRAEADSDVLARARLAAVTRDSFRERWALFWANHFTVSSTKTAVAPLTGSFEQEAIRPHVFGRFEDMALAAASHPAMLLYLDQAQSVGPGSRAAEFLARRGKAAGLNENLAREIMELHTVGVEAGYSQTDVTEFARALTGWSIAGERDPTERQNAFLFRINAHEPGARIVMGRRYADDGVAQASAIIRDLASHPSTARHIARKVAAHFIADDPPKPLVERLAQIYRDSDGRLDAVARGLISAPESWSPGADKFKTPYEFMMASWRAADTAPVEVAEVAPLLTALGQKPFSAPSPRGWPDDAAAWCAPDAMIKRMTWSEAYAAAKIGERDPVDLAENALGARLSVRTRQTIARAETRAEGLAILLMSPEFQRR